MRAAMAKAPAKFRPSTPDGQNDISMVSFPNRQPMPDDIARLLAAAETAVRAWDELRLKVLLVALQRPLPPDEEVQS